MLPEPPDLSGSKALGYVDYDSTFSAPDRPFGTPSDVDAERIRKQGGGRIQVEKKPDVMVRIKDLMEHETAGDPITGLKWTRRTTEKIAAELKTIGINVSKNTVGKLLKEMGYSLRVNAKCISSSSPAARDQQFGYIREHREEFTRQGKPVVSVDTKKKELIGRFINSGSLESFEIVLKYIVTTTTSTGLKVSAQLVEKIYEKGEKIADSIMKRLPIIKHPLLPQWNYTLLPTEM